MSKNLQREPDDGNLDQEPVALADEIDAGKRLDEELVALGNEVMAYATTALTLAKRGSVPTDPSKVHVRDRLEAVRHAWRNLRPADGAPYHDARMLLTEGLIFYAACEKDAPSESDGKRGAARALSLAKRVASYYPTIESKLTEPARLELIRLAILTKAQRRTMPWVEIAKVWDGIEAVPRNPEQWRKDWHEHRKRPPAAGRT